MWSCKHCNKLFEFIKTADKANHSRWCDANPKISDYKNNPMLLLSIHKTADTKYGTKTQFSVICNKCNIEFSVIEREQKFPSKQKYFCSISCSNSHVVTDNQRKKTSESLTGKPYVKPFNKVKNCENCQIEFTFIKQYALIENRFCSHSCATTFTTRDRNKESRKNRDALTNYRADCAFKFSLNNYPTEFEFALVEQHGWYKPKNRGDNLYGVSRDHMVSVKYGFDNNIDSTVISHPANCRLMLQSENVSKNSKNHITYEELLVRIQEWDSKYNK